MLTPTELELYRKLQPVIREKMGEIKHGDKYIDYRGHIEIFCEDCNVPISLTTTIRLPLPIDPINPERGIAGMLGENLRGMRRINGNRWIVETYDWKPESGCKVFVADTITDALLRALAHQEGVEVC